MIHLQLFAVTEDGPRPLPVPADATSFEDLYQGLALGVYSALRTFDHNKFLHLEAHLARTQRSMALLGWTYELNEAQLRRALHEVCTAFPAPEMRVRFDVLAQPATALGSESRVLIALQPFEPLPDRYYEEGVGVALAPALARTRPLAKTADFAQTRHDALPVARTQETYEYLLLSESGALLEGTGTNFWAVRDGVVWTAGEGVLAGVTRGIILALLRELEIPVRLEAVPVSEVDTLDEAALSGSSRAFLPVVRISGHVIGDGRPGPISRRVLQSYNAYVARTIETAVAPLLAS